MAYASVTYTSASGTTFALTNSDGNAIEYLRQSDISVTVNGTLQTQGTNYTFNSAGTSIILTSAVSNATVVISRTTTITDATVSFTAGSTLTAQDLNNSDRQNRFALQEFSDIYDSLRTGTGDLGDLGGFIDAGETWVSDAAHAATTNAIDARVDSKIDSALTGDVVAGNAITITDNSPASGQITVAVTNGAIDTAELTDSAVTTAKIADSNVTTAKINDSAVTTAKINDAAVTTAKLANDSVTSAKIADGTIIAGDIANSAVTTAKILDGNVTTAKIADSNVTTAKINDAAITEAKIAGSAVTNAKIASGAVDSTKMSGATVVTNSEHSGSTPNDTSFFTTSASDARYFRQDSSETISSGSTWSGSDNFIATTAAIDARIIDLVDDVGGFVPIANETSFPAANPDLPDEAGTIISIKEITTTRTPSSGTVTIANGSGSNTVTINGCGSTVLASGFGVLVETTSTLHTYTFHRLVPKATEVTTVAGIASNVTTVANNASAVTTVANDLNETTSEIETVANSISNVDAVGGSIANVNTVASNISSVNSFANVYRIASSDPTTSLDVGDLVFNTSNNKLRIYNGSSWQDGVTATGDLVSKTGDTMTGALGITSGTAGSPSLFISGDTNTGIYSPGADQVAISTGGTGRLFIDSSGRVGVGTTSPATKLAVIDTNGSITFGNSSSDEHKLSWNEGSIIVEADPANLNTSSSIQFKVDATERLRIDSSGRVGVGTSSPQAKFEVAGDAVIGTDNAALVEFTNTGVPYFAVAADASNYRSTRINVVSSGGYADLSFDAMGTAAKTALPSAGTLVRNILYLDASSGNVGVGTTTPDGTLHVQGTNSGGTLEALVLKNNATAANTETAIRFTNTTSTFNHASIVGTRSGTGTLDFYTADSSNAAMRIDSSGRVGIGTSSPNSLLTLDNNADSCKYQHLSRRLSNSIARAAALNTYNGGICTTETTASVVTAAISPIDTGVSAAQGWAFIAGNNSAIAERMRIDSSGNVGIGTTSSAVGRVGILANTNAEALSLISRPSDDQCELHFRNSADNATLARISTSGGQNFAVRTGTSEAFRVDSSQRLLIGHSSSQGSGTRLEVNSNTSGVANVAIVKRNSGTANQHGQNLDFYNFGPSATARADGTEIGAVRFYASQPTSGAAQLGAGIYCSADGTQSGNSVPSKLSFYTSSGTSVPERIRIKADGAVSLGDWHTSSGYHRINRKVAQGGEILIISAYDTANTDTARFFSINTGAYNTNNAALHIGRDSATSRSINAGGTVNASGADYAEYMTKAGDFSLAKGDVCGVNADGKLTNVFAEAISFVVKSTDPSYVGGDTWGTEEAIGKKPDAEDADALAEWEANLEAARQTVDRIAFAGQVPVNVTGATAGQYIIPLQAADGSIEGSAKNEADLTLSEYMQAVGKVIAIEDDGRARIIVKVA